MTLEAGSRIGPYEVIAPVGAGGMGEVWRARDPRIGREVAIKVLPKEFAESSDRLHRFEQEARAAGSLSHPNLVTIHELGTHDGAPYIAMEMLEGATLREKLRGGHGSGGSASGVGTALPTRKAVEIAMQVATGLAAAHDKGLVHRDLKPENIFVTGDGIAKILDFGLVKLSSNFGGDFEEQPTVPRSSPGVALGTAGYMSPEQVSGGTIDGRSDIFSLGAVLYELLSGGRAFHGPTAVETMNAILHEDPPALSGETSRIPPTLDRIVRRCLEKEPRQRFQSARDVVFALEAMGDASSGSGERIEARRVLKRSTWLRVAALFAVVVLGAAGGAAFVTWRSAQAEPEVPHYRRLTFRRGNLLSARFSPDGRTIYYAAAWDGKPAEVFAVGRDGASPQALGLKNCDVVSVSGRGELAILRQDLDMRAPNSMGMLARVPASGGAPRDVASDVAHADWFPSGAELAAIRLIDDQLVLEAPIGKVIHRSLGLLRCRVSPDGSMVAAVEAGTGGAGVLVLDLNGRVVRKSRTYQTLEGMAWSRDGRQVLVTVDGGILVGIGIDGRDREIDSAPGRTVLHDIAADGSLLFEQFGGRVSHAVARGQDELLEEFSWLDQTGAVDLTSSGDTILFQDRTPEATVPGSYLRKLGESAPTYIGNFFPCAITPDGSVVLAASAGDELFALPTGTGAPKSLGIWQILRGVATAPDGKVAFAVGTRPGSPEGLYRVPLDGREPSLVTTRRLTVVSRVSPDGRRLAVVDGLQPAVLDLEKPDSVVPVPGANQWDLVVGWSSDSKSLFVSAPGYEPAIYRVDLATGKRELVRRVVPQDRSDVMNTWIAAATPDARTILCRIFRATNSDLWIAEGIR
ncbi:MAG: protein kinase [Thermoanaerobaculia bacterium]|jgi:hypothetical protein